MDVTDNDAYEKLNQSSMEISYLSSVTEAGGRTYVSRQIQFQDMSDIMAEMMFGGD